MPLDDAPSRRGRVRLAAFVLLAVVAAACSFGSSDDGSADAADFQPGDHPIGVRQGANGGEFFDKRTGEVFQPRGPAYLRMLVENGQNVRVQLFPPDTFDADITRQDLTAMRDLGFNTVRVFLDLCRLPQPCIVTEDGSLDPAYMDSIAEFLRIASETQMQAILASVRLPDQGYAASIPEVDGVAGTNNRQYLTGPGVDATVAYWRDLITALQERGAPLDAVLGYEIVQEQYVNGDEPPVSQDAGTVTTGNGQTYDMADPAAKQRMIEDNVIHLINQVRAAVVELDPTALVTMGFFTPYEPHELRLPDQDPRVVHTSRIFQESALDFIDIHAYPYGGFAGVQEYADNFGITGGDPKPIILGELGGVVAAYPSATDAAGAIVDWQVQSCAVHMDGWIHWRWEDSVSDVYGSLVEGGVINQALSPLNRPDPCAFGDVVPPPSG